MRKYENNNLPDHRHNIYTKTSFLLPKILKNRFPNSHHNFSKIYNHRNKIYIRKKTEKQFPPHLRKQISFYSNHYPISHNLLHKYFHLNPLVRPKRKNQKLHAKFNK